MDRSRLRRGAGSGSERIRGRARLFELIGLVLALEERANADERERRRRDREIGAEIAEERGLGLLRSWLARAPSAALRRRIDRVRSSLAGLSALLLALGVFFGWAAASALLSIEVHEGRINVVLAVALLVLIPFGMLVASVLAWLWSLRAASSGGDAARSLGERIRSATVGRLGLRLLAPEVRQDVEVVLGRMSAHGRLYGRVVRGQLMRWSQTLGLGFGVGALMATLAFVVFTDLAFGWSTTLDIAPEQVHRWTQRLASPWAALWPEASPSLELVESTRFFRVALDDPIHVVDPILYGGWWPFLVMAILCYVVLPRALLALAIAAWHAREIGRAMGLTPGVDRLVDRLRTPLVEGQATREEGPVGRALDALAPEVDHGHWIVDRGGAAPIVIRWAELLDDAALERAIGMAPFRILDAGGRRSLEEDAAVARESATASAPIVFCVRGYEPPVLDVLDFLSLLRTQVGRERGICVLLIDARDSDMWTWRRALSGLGDSRLVVSRVGEGADA